MRVVHVASEVAPYAQSGGLADVLGGLPPALAAQGHDVAVVAPLYRGVEAKVIAAGLSLDTIPIVVALGPHTITCALRTMRRGRTTFAFVDCPPLYDRTGLMYGPNATSEWGDNHLRFGLLGKVAADHGDKLVGGPVDVMHAHDWQGAPAAVYARLARARCAIVTTIHNLAFRGIFPKHTMNDLGWPWSHFDLHRLEFYDQLSFLKGAIALSDATTTVSPSYAKEILTPQFGEALDAFLRTDVRNLSGIVNGIDVTSWDPSSDPALPATFSASSIENKATCRAAIAAEHGLTLTDNQPLFAVIARMAGQKGLDLVADIVPELFRLDAKLLVLGSGEPDLEARFAWLANVFSDHLAVRIGFDINLSRRIYAGSDFFLMPSRFEPCGLGQLYAMRYGSIPIVHAVGGLRDTVKDPGDDALARGEGTGISFTPAAPIPMLRALERAVALYRKPAAFTALRRAAMSRDSSWDVPARQYVELYRSLLPRT